MYKDKSLFQSGNLKPKVVIFNLATDSNDSKLAATIDWIREFSQVCESVFVFSTHVGSYELPDNVKVFELGGGNYIQKIRWFYNILWAANFTIKLRGKKVVFHYMNQFTAVFPGIMFKIFGIRQGLWYAHGYKSKILYFAEKIVDLGFTSAPGAFPIKSRKVIYLGQGIKIVNFDTFEYKDFYSKKGIVSLGRIHPVKNLDKLLYALPIKKEINLEFLGDDSNTKYVQHILSISENRNLNLNIKGEILYEDVPNYLSSWKYYYCGTDISVDKASIEASLAGCIILTMNENVMNLSGMTEVYKYLGMVPPDNILEQLEVFENISTDQLSQIQRILFKISSERNDVSQSISIVLSRLLSV